MYLPASRSKTTQYEGKTPTATVHAVVGKPRRFYVVTTGRSAARDTTGQTEYVNGL